MINHISSVVRSCFFHLCCLSQLRQYQNRQTANTIAVSLVSSRLDYRNSCVWSMPKNQLLSLQRVQNTNEFVKWCFEPSQPLNTAAGLVTQTERSDYITAILRERHWLPVDMRSDYKIPSLVHSCMNSTALQYLQESIPSYLPVRRLRSFTQSRLRIPSFDQGNNKKQFGVRAFSDAAPKL